jgi:APA family basic amino acid/polyamine antiporter
MIGSGIFLLPAVLAPYGGIGFAGWAVTAGGSILLALTVGRLAGRTARSGGVYVYTRDAFGDFAGFIIAWGYWSAYWIALPAMAIAFVGYLVVFMPALETNPLMQAGTALALIWTVALINMRGVSEAGFVQLVMTVMKLIPLALIIALAVFTGDAGNLPEFHPKGGSVLSAIAATTLLTMWAFSGMEAGTMPASDVKDPEKTIPRAIIIGTLTVAFVYIASTFAVMLLAPPGALAVSTSPFADVARGLGAWGPGFIAVGAMISTAGALNGVMFVSGQTPMAVALDGLAPKILARRGRGGAPTLSLLLSATLASGLLLANFARGLVDVFAFLIMMSTTAFLAPLLVSALAEFRHSWQSATGWAGVAAAAALYSIFAILGSGLAVLGWGAILFAAGVPVYFLGRVKAGETA